MEPLFYKRNRSKPNYKIPDHWFLLFQRVVDRLIFYKPNTSYLVFFYTAQSLIQYTAHNPYSNFKNESK